MYAILAEGDAAGTGGLLGGGMIGMLIWIVVLFGVMYFLMIRPQKKEQQKKELMLKEVAVGDTVLTTSGFYGTVRQQQKLPHPDAEGGHIRGREAGGCTGIVGEHETDCAALGKRGGVL